jgi:uncharacterized protein YidB (DUF937 family)
MKMMLAMAAAVTAVAATGGVAHADTQDDQFLQTVRSQGINADPAALIGFAHQMCDVAGGPGGLGPLSSLMATQGLSAQQASNVAFDATRIYCPDKTPIVPPAFAPAG